MPLNEQEAHDEANMLSVEAGPRPTARDYDEALALLERLQMDAERESEVTDKMAKPVKSIFAGLVTAAGAAPKLFALAFLNVLHATKLSGTPKEYRENDLQQLKDAIENIPETYDRIRGDLASAREQLEAWKAEAEEFAKNQVK